MQRPCFMSTASISNVSSANSSTSIRVFFPLEPSPVPPMVASPSSLHPAHVSSLNCFRTSTMDTGCLHLHQDYGIHSWKLFEERCHEIMLLRPTRMWARPRPLHQVGFQHCYRWLRQRPSAMNHCSINPCPCLRQKRRRKKKLFTR